MGHPGAQSLFKFLWSVPWASAARLVHTLQSLSALACLNEGPLLGEVLSSGFLLERQAPLKEAGLYAVFQTLGCF